MRKAFVLTTASVYVGLLLCASAALSAAAGPVISGGGVVNVMDADSNLFPLAGEFSVSGGLTPNGAAHGSINFVFRGDFARYWGAVPGVTNVFHLTGTVTEVSVSGDEITLRGTLTETDFATGQGVVFVEENVPFEIVMQAGSRSFVMQFCLLPPFVMEVAKGNLDVHGL
jgi:hypothetical protein